MSNEASEPTQITDMHLLIPPFLLRVGAGLIDYIIFLILPLAGLISERTVGNNGLGILSDRTVWLLAFVIGFINCVLLPQIAGQSLGKMITGIRIVSSGLEDVGRIRLFVRQTIGYALTLATFGIGFLAAAVLPSGRTLHDAISGTRTLRARKTLVKI